MDGAFPRQPECGLKRQRQFLYPSKEARDDTLETGMKDGVDESFNCLADYLRTLREDQSSTGAIAACVAIASRDKISLRK
jgi:hypothetical protein